MIWNGIFPLVSSSNKFVIWVHFPDFTLHVLHCDCCTWAHHDAETTYRSSSPNLCTSVLSAPPLSHLVPPSLSPFNSPLLDLVAPFLLSCSPPLSYFFARPLLLMRKWKHRYISHLTALTDQWQPCRLQCSPCHCFHRCAVSILLQICGEDGGSSI